METTMRLPLIAAMSLMTATSFAKSAQPLTATALDVIADPKSFTNKVVSVSQCSLYAASSKVVICGVLSKNHEQIGKIGIWLSGLPVDQRKSVLENCAGDTETVPCDDAVVTGRLTKYYDILTFRTATITFRTP